MTNKADNTNNDILETLNLNTKPQSKAVAANSPIQPEMKEFVIFLRNGIRDLIYNNRFYDFPGGNKIADNDKVLKV